MGAEESGGGSGFGGGSEFGGGSSFGGGGAGGGRGYGRADISALGLESDPFGSFGESFGRAPGARGLFDPGTYDEQAKALAAALRAEFLGQLGVLDTFGRFVKGAFGLHTGPYSLKGTPAGRALDLAVALGTMSPIPGAGFAARVMRGGAEISPGIGQQAAAKTGFGTTDDAGLGLDPFGAPSPEQDLTQLSILRRAHRLSGQLFGATA